MYIHTPINFFRQKAVYACSATVWPCRIDVKCQSLMIGMISVLERTAQYDLHFCLWKSQYSRNECFFFWYDSYMTWYI